MSTSKIKRFASFRHRRENVHGERADKCEADARKNGRDRRRSLSAGGGREPDQDVVDGAPRVKDIVRALQKWKVMDARPAKLERNGERAAMDKRKSASIGNVTVFEGYRQRKMEDNMFLSDGNLANAFMQELKKTLASRQWLPPASVSIMSGHHQSSDHADLVAGDSCSDRSAGSLHQQQPRFLTRGAFLLTPSHDLTLDRAANILDKMTFRGDFSVTKTATGILFRFSEPEDFQTVFRRGFHRATGGRLYRKVVVPCRPHRTFSLLVLDIPADLPEEDVRASLYRYGSVVEVTRLGQGGTQVQNQALPPNAPPPIRITLASLDEYNALLQHGLDFYGATYFPTEPLQGSAGGAVVSKEPGTTLMFDATGYTRIPAPAPASRTLRTPSRQTH